MLVSVSYKKPIDTISTNVLGTANLLEALRKSDHHCIAVIITSDKCYDNVEWEWVIKNVIHLGGKDIYGGSKGAVELVVKSYFHSFLKITTQYKAWYNRSTEYDGGSDWAIDRIVPDSMRAWSENQIVENPKS